MNDDDGRSSARPQDYDELIGLAEEMLRDTHGFIERTTDASARERMETLAGKLEADIERYRRARDKHRGF